MPNYESQWINDPPIVELNKNQMAGEVDLFETRINSIREDFATPSMQSVKLDARWEYHLTAAKSVIGQFRNRFTNDTNGLNRCFTYRVVGTPVALMSILTPLVGSSLTVGELVSHPQAEGAGSIMIEFAVNLSESLNRGGKLYLVALTTDTIGPYLRLGFEQAEHLSKQMNLDPRTAEIDNKKAFVWVSQKWRYAKSQHLQYLEVTKWDA